MMSRPRSHLSCWQYRTALTRQTDALPILELSMPFLESARLWLSRPFPRGNTSALFFFLGSLGDSAQRGFHDPLISGRPPKETSQPDWMHWASSEGCVSSFPLLSPHNRKARQCAWNGDITRQSNRNLWARLWRTKAWVGPSGMYFDLPHPDTDACDWVDYGGEIISGQSYYYSVSAWGVWWIPRIPSGESTHIPRMANRADANKLL